ncbi:hypothetical protein PoB_003174900 [Plakobranchus ocellatus]|uniref:Uncharacterized protein n=1 Tax=Plakobranchus ocellatus TaxID=259542 RepID=A0AAV4AFN5_9GAST|nr:hypothetical protein PoB_003174900 [Plakobranchus ocellatus]
MEDLEAVPSSHAKLSGLVGYGILEIVFLQGTGYSISAVALCCAFYQRQPPPMILVKKAPQVATNHDIVKSAPQVATTHDIVKTAAQVVTTHDIGEASTTGSHHL